MFTDSQVILGAFGSSKLRPKRPAGHVTLEGKAAAEPAEKASPPVAKGTEDEQI